MMSVKHCVSDSTVIYFHVPCMKLGKSTSCESFLFLHLSDIRAGQKFLPAGLHWNSQDGNALLLVYYVLATDYVMSGVQFPSNGFKPPPHLGYLVEGTPKLKLGSRWGTGSKNILKLKHCWKGITMGEKTHCNSTNWRFLVLIYVVSEESVFKCK